MSNTLQVRYDGTYYPVSVRGYTTVTVNADLLIDVVLDIKDDSTVSNITRYPFIGKSITKLQFTPSTQLIVPTVLGEYDNSDVGMYKTLPPVSTLDEAILVVVVGDNLTHMVYARDYTKASIRIPSPIKSILRTLLSDYTGHVVKLYTDTLGIWHLVPYTLAGPLEVLQEHRFLIYLTELSKYILRHGVGMEYRVPDISTVLNINIYGTVLSAWRVERKLTGGFVANKFKVDPAYYRQCESGRRPVSTDLMLKACKYYGKSLPEASHIPSKVEELVRAIHNLSVSDRVLAEALINKTAIRVNR